MNKTELVALVAKKNELTKKDAEKLVNSVFDSIIESVAAGEKLQLIGFGVFEQRARAERSGSNPKTGEKIVIPASKIPVFKAGKAFKDAVNK